VADFSTLVVAADDAIGSITLNRPERLNALSRLTLRELAAAARWFDAQPSVKVVVVGSVGRAFSAGFDLDDFASPDPAATPRDEADLGRLMAEAVTDMRAITIAAIKGRCVGGGVVLAGSCDFRVAADDTIFSIPEVDLGIPLAWGGIPRLVREIGPAFTKELVLTCREFGPDEAHQLRFVNRVVPLAQLDTAVSALARELATKSSFTLTTTKRHVNRVTEELASTAGAVTDADVLNSARSDPESRQAGRDYLERRRRS
jgi:enoyl-CoA hydratase/carnithine racemase